MCGFDVKLINVLMLSILKTSHKIFAKKYIYDNSINLNSILSSKLMGNSFMNFHIKMIQAIYFNLIPHLQGAKII